VIVLFALLMGVDPTRLLQDTALTGGQVQAPAQYEGTAAQDEAGEFVSMVLADTESTWHSILDSPSGTYVEPKLVLYSGSVRSACGFAQAAMGPFYCPADQKVYLDTTFFDDLERRFGAPGDFAEAYVIAHEIGHHVQTLLGITPQVEALRRRASSAEANALSVRLELQADCFAGVWANRAQRDNLILDVGDLEEGLNAASAIGDDRLQMQAQGYVVPDAFTHGTSAQREKWFRRGLESGDISACDTFAEGP
jgi:predicted metalloprotease